MTLRAIAVASLWCFASSHGLWIGAGPYVAGTATHETTSGDGLLGAAQTVSLQTAIAISAGYHGHLAFATGVYAQSPRNGLHSAVRYHHLEGVRLDDAASEFVVPIDPDGQPIPSGTITASVAHDASWFGRGRAIDGGVALVLDEWEIGATIRGLANVLDWGDGRRLTLPREYATHAAFHTERWSLRGAYIAGFQRTSVATGAEFRTGPLAFRAGLRHMRGRIHPSGGVGVAFAGDKGIDVAVFTSTLPVTGDRLVAAALSFRIGLATMPPAADSVR